MLESVVIRCLIVDDNLDFLEAAQGLLESEGLEVVALESTSAGAIASTRALRPDVVLVDLYLGEESGLELARQMHDDLAPGGPAIILVSTYAELDLADLVAEIPLKGFLAKGDLSAASIRSIMGLGDGTS